MNPQAADPPHGTTVSDFTTESISLSEQSKVNIPAELELVPLTKNRPCGGYEEYPGSKINESYGAPYC